MNRPIDLKELHRLTLLPLYNGDRMAQPEFHRRYQDYPSDTKFELIGGTVYMASPLSMQHSDFHDEVVHSLTTYRRATPGTQVLHGATIILGPESEPEPDLALRIRSDHGGQSRERREESGATFFEGPPELIAEIAFSSRAIDLHRKRDDYQRAGVQEYLVVSVEERQLYWFDFANGGEITPTRQGVYRSRIFPGLWIDGPALLALSSEQVEATLRRGLMSREHAAFVRRLRAAYQPPSE